MKENLPFLQHILKSINNILEDTEKGRDEFFRNRTVQDAVVRNFQVIGEATKNLSIDIRETYAGIPWKEMAGMRDRLVHGYFGINYTLVWDVIEHELPNLKTLILSVIEKESDAQL